MIMDTYTANAPLTSTLKILSELINNHKFCLNKQVLATLLQISFFCFFFYSVNINKSVQNNQNLKFWFTLYTKCGNLYEKLSGQLVMPTTRQLGSCGRLASFHTWLQVFNAYDTEHRDGYSLYWGG